MGLGDQLSLIPVDLGRGELLITLGKGTKWGSPIESVETATKYEVGSVIY